MTNMEKIPVCRLRLSRESFGVADSHLGGVPYVPHEGTIPTDEDGNQLWLCAQINFAQMPFMENFPKSGILQIFLSDWGIDDFGLCEEPTEDGTPQNDWKTAWYPEIDPTVTMEECAAKMVVPWEEASKKNMPRPPHKFDLKDIEEGHLDLWRCPDVPLKMDFLPVELEGRETPGGCKIGGYPQFYQSDPREYAEDFGLPLEEWDTLLFQLDDDDTDFPIGDIGEMDLYLGGCGSLNLLIRTEDLKNRDFSRVLAQWACT